MNYITYGHKKNQGQNWDLKVLYEWHEQGTTEDEGKGTEYLAALGGQWRLQCRKIFEFGKIFER